VGWASLPALLLSRLCTLAPLTMESITDAISGDKCLRGQQVGSLNLYLWSNSGLGKLVKSPNGQVYDASENAARNIGIKYLAGKFEKPMMYKPQGLEDVVISWQPGTSSKGVRFVLEKPYMGESRL
jgi:hypothetical protein